MKESWIVAGEPTGKDVSDRRAVREDTTQLAIKLREELLNCEQKIGDCVEFAQLMDSVNMLIRAITEEGESPLSGSVPRKSTQGIAYSGGRPSIPTSLH